jgi:hypothetical protein
LHNTPNKQNQENLKQAKPKQKDTKTCTNQIKELMKQLKIDFKNISKREKKNDVKKGKRKARKFVMQKQQRYMCNVGTSAM